MRPLVPSKPWLFLLIVTGCVILNPFLHGIPLAGFLSQGDHGRELYAYAHALDGTIPYRDYWWIYGPLMPFYYALFMKLLGVSLASVLIGKALLLLIAGIFVALTVALLSFPAAGFIAGIWFWIKFPDFFHTWNHAGGILCLTAMAFCLVAWLRTQRTSFAWWSLGLCALLALVKLNMGILTLAAVILTILIPAVLRKKLTDFDLKFLAASLILMPLSLFLVYFALVNGLNADQIWQCFPYGKASRQNALPLWDGLLDAGRQMLGVMRANLLNQLIAGTFVISLGRLLLLLSRKKLAAHFPGLPAALLGLTLLLFITLHERLLSNITYSSFWGQPIWMIIMLTVIACASATVAKPIRIIVTVLFLISAGLTLQRHWAPHTFPEATRLFSRQPGIGAYVINGQDWINVAMQTTSFLRTNLKPEEQFLAIPYDPLYYYLAGKKSPLWHTCIIEIVAIPPHQEKEILRQLEASKVNWIVLSNRYVSTEPGVGTLGQDYGVQLANYINANFQMVTSFGNIQVPGGWAWDHATIILKRNQPL